jgi:hypothetical protein
MNTLSVTLDHGLRGFRHRWTIGIGVLAAMTMGLTVGGLTGHTLERLLDTSP